MKCESCAVTISPAFSHAINNNQCPACGKQIMKQAKLASFLSLKTLLDHSIPEKGVDVDKIASLIVANFELKQIFKEDLQKSDEEGIMEVSEDDPEEKEEEKILDPDAEYKAKQKRDAKAILQKMRDEALDGALEERYGLGEGGLLLPDEDAGIYETINKHKQDNSLSAIRTGGGIFTRG